MNGLEREYPPFKPTKERPDAIVVLSGGIREVSWTGIKNTTNEASLARLLEGMALFRDYNYKGQVPLIISGGSGDPERRQAPDAPVMAETADRLGMPKEKVLVEGDSRNTLESAAAVAKLIKGRKIVLVTSAFHMRRSLLMFEKQGFIVQPAPTDFLSSRRPTTPHSFIPRAGDLFLTATALQEYLSRTWYGLRGEI